MEKVKAPYSNSLYIIGILNVYLSSFFIPLTLSLIFSPLSPFLIFINSFLFLLNIPFLKIVCEKVEKKWIRIIVVLISFLLLFLIKEEVLRTSLLITYVIYGFLFIFLPQKEGSVVLSRPYIYLLVLYLLMYAFSQIANNAYLEIATLFITLSFLLLFLLDKNMRGVREKIRSREYKVSRDGIMRANRKVILIYLLVFVLLSILLPSVMLLKEERKESEVSYDFWLRETEEEIYKEVVIKEKGKSRNATPFELERIGNFLVYFFLFALVVALAVIVYSVFRLLFSIEKSERSDTEEKREEFFISEVEIKKEIKKKKEERVSFLSPEWRIRRMFKKYILSRSEGKKIDNYNVEELTVLFSSPEELKEIYRETRYSNKKTEKDEVKVFSEIIKRENKKSSK